MPAPPRASSGQNVYASVDEKNLNIICSLISSHLDTMYLDHIHLKLSPFTNSQFMNKVRCFRD